MGAPFRWRTHFLFGLNGLLIAHAERVAACKRARKSYDRACYKPVIFRSY
jgi:hypothetical protein